ncbi:MAG: hypothetical protein ABI647_16770 [Gemmatimonadota bacterium]
MKELCGALALAGALVVAGRSAAAQVQARVMAQGILVGIRADPTPERRPITEVRLSQPTAMGVASWRNLTAILTLDFEGLTIPGGELTAGAWGEGFIDRRHPHTYVHEALLGAVKWWGAGRTASGVAAFAGKGFVPFGSDDPMSRPTERYPVNHHWSQILERAVVIGQVRYRWAVIEAALFNGDEPERPEDWPRISGRFGDSWSLRGTVDPLEGLEVSGSVASVESPENRPGAGSTQQKTHVGVRYESRVKDRYAMAEWARTSEFDGFFVFKSVLAEAGWRPGRNRIYYRFERTDRPEEERLNPFRSLRPHLENSIFGITRWTLHTAGYGYSVGRGSARFEPFAEATVGRVDPHGAGLFSIVDTYGKSSVTSVSLGVRLGWNVAGHRMGRYGVALPVGHGQGHHH